MSLAACCGCQRATAAPAGGPGYTKGFGCNSATCETEISEAAPSSQEVELFGKALCSLMINYF